MTGTETVVFTPDLPTGRAGLPAGAQRARRDARGNQLVVTRRAARRRGQRVRGGRREPLPGGSTSSTLAGGLAAGESTEVELDFTLRLGGGGFERLGAARASPGGPAAHRCWPGSPASAGPGTRSSRPRRDRHQPGRRHHHLGRRARGAHRADDRRPGRADPGTRRPPHLDVARAGRPRRQRRGGRVHHRRGRRGRRPGDHRRAARLRAPTRPGWPCDTGHGDHRAQRAASGRSPTRRSPCRCCPTSAAASSTPRRSCWPARRTSCWCTRSRTCGSTGWSATPSSATRGWTRRSPATPSRSPASRRPAQVARRLAIDGDVGGSMAAFPGDGTYFAAVYGKGAAALLTARQQAGAEAFDAALRCYVDAQAWSIATPADVAAALADLPAALGRPRAGRGAGPGGPAGLSRCATRGGAPHPPCWLPVAVVPYTRLTWGQWTPPPACPGVLSRVRRCRGEARPGPRPARGVAQLAEQRSPKPQAAGSSPVTPATHADRRPARSPSEPPPRGERGAVSDEKPGRDGDARRRRADRRAARRRDPGRRRRRRARGRRGRDRRGGRGRRGQGRRHARPAAAGGHRARRRRRRQPAPADAPPATGEGTRSRAAAERARAAELPPEAQHRPVPPRGRRRAAQGHLARPQAS